MEANIVDNRPRVTIEISAHLADELEELAELLAMAFPHDPGTRHYAMGYAVQSGLISVRDTLKRQGQRVPQTTVLPSRSSVSSAFRTLANPRGRLRATGA